MGAKNDARYPPEWPAVSLATKEAAGWRCVRCRHPYRPGDDPRACDEQCTHDQVRELRDGVLVLVSIQNRVLTVHHADGVKTNLRWFNLLPLCQVCHLQVQAKVRMDQVYLYPHTEWFKPFAAGFYAFTVLGEDLTREQVEARMDELLAAGQPWLANT